MPPSPHDKDTARQRLSTFLSVRRHVDAPHSSSPEISLFDRLAHTGVKASAPRSHRCSPKRHHHALFRARYLSSRKCYPFWSLFPTPEHCLAFHLAQVALRSNARAPQDSLRPRPPPRFPSHPKFAGRNIHTIPHTYRCKHRERSERVEPGGDRFLDFGIRPRCRWEARCSACACSMFRHS